jgi:hypothetical protein
MLAQGTTEDIDQAVTDIQGAFPGYIRETKITELPASPEHTAFKITF